MGAEYLSEGNEAGGPAGAERRKRHRGTLPYSTHAGDGVVVSSYGERSLRLGHPWVRRHEVVARTGAMVPGRVVSIRSRGGEVLGTGVWDEGAIEVRRFREEAGPIDSDLLRERVTAARARRPLPPETTAWRWVNGEHDDLPGIIVDVWDRQLTLSLASASLLGLVEPLVDVLVDAHEADAVWLCLVDGAKAGAEGGVSEGLLWGHAGKRPVHVRELGLRFEVRPWLGAGAGLPCIGRQLRAWLAPHWAGRRVLDLFSTSGVFGIAAARGGSYEVTSRCATAEDLARVAGNLHSNGLSPGEHPVRLGSFEGTLAELARTGDTFDVVILDPPASFVEDGQEWTAAYHYARMVELSLQVLSPGGWLVAACTHEELAPKAFAKALRDGARRSGRPLRLIHKGAAPVDFPIGLHVPGSPSFKSQVLTA